MSEGFTGAAPVAANGGNGHAGDEPSRPVALPVHHHPGPAAAMADTDETTRSAENKPLAERLRALQHTAARH
jgi:hypothetical protein